MLRASIRNLPDVPAFVHWLMARLLLALTPDGRYIAAITASAVLHIPLDDVQAISSLDWSGSPPGGFERTPLALAGDGQRIYFGRRLTCGTCPRRQPSPHLRRATAIRSSRSPPTLWARQSESSP